MSCGAAIRLFATRANVTRNPLERHGRLTGTGRCSRDLRRSHHQFESEVI